MRDSAFELGGETCCEDCRSARARDRVARRGRVQVGSRHRHSVGAAVGARQPAMECPAQSASRAPTARGSSSTSPAGRINGVEDRRVAGRAKRCRRFAPPSKVEDAHVVDSVAPSQPNIASMEMATRLVAEADHGAAQLSFPARTPNAVRARFDLARDVLLDVDEKSQISGLWLLNVPPSPADA